MIYHPRISEIAIPASTLSEHVLLHAPARGDKPALIDGSTGETLTYAQLDAMSARAASGLVQAGVTSGDVVALISHKTVWSGQPHGALD